MSAVAKPAPAPFSMMGPIDIVESDKQFVFKVDAPGIRREDVHVRVVDGALQISGERCTETTKDEGKFKVRERSSGKFCRAFMLPAQVNQDAVTANIEHGVLSIVVPKSAPPKPEDIAAKEGTGELNKVFEEIPISVFPTPALGSIITIPSSMPVLEAAKLLAKNRILAAPVRDVAAPDDASWSEKYMGTVSMVGLTFLMLDTLKPADPKDFMEEIEKVDAFSKTTVAEAVHSARLGPFVPVDHDRGNLLDAMLLCGQHYLHRVPVVKSPGDITNIITQSALVQTLAANLERFESVGKRSLKEHGFGEPARVVSAKKTNTLMEAFDLIRQNNVSAVPVVDDNNKVVGCVSGRDVRLIINSTKIYKLLRLPLSTYLSVVTEGQDNAAITVTADENLETAITRMVASRVHRVFVVDADGKLVRVVSLPDILRKFTKEPADYFGHYFSY